MKCITRRNGFETILFSPILPLLLPRGLDSMSRIDLRPCEIDKFFPPALDKILIFDQRPLAGRGFNRVAREIR